MRKMTVTETLIGVLVQRGDQSITAPLDVIETVIDRLEGRRPCPACGSRVTYTRGPDTVTARCVHGVIAVVPKEIFDAAVGLVREPKPKVVWPC